MKQRADLCRREAGELLRNISIYPGLSETQLCRFFPGKEETIRTLLAHMVHTGWAVLSAEGRYFASAEQLDQYDPNIARAVRVLLDLLPQVAFLLPPLQAALDGFCKTHSFPLYDRCVVCVEHVYDAALPHGHMRDYDNLQLKPVLDMVALYAMQDDSSSLCDLYQTSCLEFKPCTRVTVLPPETFPHWLESHGNGAKTLSENRSILPQSLPTTEKCRRWRRNAALAVSSSGILHRSQKPPRYNSPFGTRKYGKTKATSHARHQGLRPLALTALSGEYPASSVSRLVGRTAYTEKVVARLKADGLLRTVYRDRLRGYRPPAAAKRRLLPSDPSRFAFYLTGSTDTNRVKSEPVRRLRLHRVAQVYTSVYKAGITLFRDEKPCPFSAALHHSSPAAFYGSREVKEMGVEAVKIRGSRMVGVLAAPGGQIEQDAMTAVGQPVLFACLPDLPRLFRFCSALKLYDRQGVLVCFDFQAAALKQGCA